MLLIPAALTGFGVYHLAKNYDNRMQELQGAVAKINKMTPVSNRYANAATSSQITQAQPQRVIPDVDLRGVPFYHVDFGGGVLHRTYTQPVFLANGGQYSYP